MGDCVITTSTEQSNESPFKMERRTSPSVIIPRKRKFESTISATCRDPELIVRIESLKVLVGYKKTFSKLEYFKI